MVMSLLSRFFGPPCISCGEFRSQQEATLEEEHVTDTVTQRTRVAFAPTRPDATTTTQKMRHAAAMRLSPPLPWPLVLFFHGTNFAATIRTLGDKTCLTWLWMLVFTVSMCRWSTTALRFCASARPQERNEKRQRTSEFILIVRTISAVIKTVKQPYLRA